jgi:hypothetical protein
MKWQNLQFDPICVVSLCLSVSARGDLFATPQPAGGPRYVRFARLERQKIAYNIEFDFQGLGEELKTRSIWMVVVCFWPTGLLAQRPMYIGALGGLATLSGDGRSIITASSSATSLYDPNNGEVANVFWGWHISRYVSIQGNYVWNRNDVSLVSALSHGATSSFYQQPMSSTENAVIGDLLIYFRPRGNRVRPFLSQGGGVVHVSGRVNGNTVTSGSLLAPPGNSSSTFPASRTAVGLDVRMARVWYFRYTFGENISHNPISAELTPSGQRLLKNFQNLFGVYRTF